MRKLFTLSGLFVLVLIFVILVYFTQSVNSRQLCSLAEERDHQFF